MLTFFYGYGKLKTKGLFEEYCSISGFKVLNDKVIIDFLRDVEHVEDLAGPKEGGIKRSTDGKLYSAKDNCYKEMAKL